MKGLLWQGLSLPHQPRRKKGEERTVLAILLNNAVFIREGNFTANVKPPPRHFEHASQNVLFNMDVRHGEISCYETQMLLTARFWLYGHFRSRPREPSPFPIAEKYQNATAASDAMKGSGLAG